MAIIDIEINWQKLLCIEDFDSNLNFLEEHNGIYVWIWDGQPNRVCYIGETGKTFADRHIEHFRNHLGGVYSTYKIKPDEDFVDFLKDHFDDRSVEDLADEGFYHFPTIYLKGSTNKFQKTFFNRDQLNQRLDFLENLKFAFGDLGKRHSRRQEIEGALISGLRASYKKAAGTNLKLKKWKNPEIPIGNINKYPKEALKIIHSGEVAKDLPADFLAITAYDPERPTAKPRVTA
jgi:hypothetical protein